MRYRYSISNYERQLTSLQASKHGQPEPFPFKNQGHPNGALDDAKVPTISVGEDANHRASRVPIAYLRSHQTIRHKPTASAAPFTEHRQCCLLYTSPSPRDQRGSRMPSSA